MIKYEDIQEREISSLAEVDLKTWIIGEITDLGNDFGNKLTNDEILHAARRLVGVLKTKYKSWRVGDVHAAFQVGLSGAYGNFVKVTIRALFIFLKKAEAQRIKATVYTSEKKGPEPDLQNEIDTPWGDFSLFCSRNKIWFDELFPEWDIVNHPGEVPQAARELAAEYTEAKQMDLVHAFRRRLKQKMLSYAE